MQEKHARTIDDEPEFNKTERRLIQLYRKLPRSDRRHLRRVMLVMVKAALRHL